MAQRINRTLLILLFLCLGGCGFPPTTNFVCGPIVLFDENRTTIIGIDDLFNSFYVGHREFFEGDEDTHRVDIDSETAVVEYFQQTAGRDAQGVHHVWDNLVGFRYNRVTRILVEYSYRLGDIKTASREALLARRMAVKPLKPDWEIVWEPCRREPAWRALISRLVGLLFFV
ncbi:MAG: hypothetical protein MI747_15985 [Desulfobacterales bacterium]|nr:hypothetical protein [Desulfobacterales bacterium]